MDEPNNMGNGCGKQAAVIKDDGDAVTPELDIDEPPASLPRPLPGMGLPAWLKVVLRSDEESAIDQFALLEAYHNLWKPPHVTNEMLIQLALKVCPKAGDYEGEGRLWLLHVRWLDAYEAADAFKAGHEAGDTRRVSTTRQNAARVMDLLLTVGDGKLPEPKKAVKCEDTTTAGAARDTSTTATVTDDASALPPSPSTQPTDQNDLTRHPNNPQPLRPPRDLDREFESLKGTTSYSSVLQWLQQVLEEDPSSIIETLDISNAYTAYRDRDTNPVIVDALLMDRVVLEAFPNTECVKAEDESPFIKGLRWQKIDRPVSSTAIPHVRFPEKWRNEAHKLLHLPDPERTKLWLRSIFTIDDKFSVDLPSLWEFYERVYWRWVDTHEHLEMEEFFKVLNKSFRKAETVQVTENHAVLLGIGFKAKPMCAKAVSARKQKRDLNRLQKAGLIDSPKTAFAQKLLEDPLLMRQRRDKTGCPIPGSFVSRTRRRAGDPETHEQEPLGDEEPGFPGLSMKRQQAAYKRELEAYQKKMTELQQELDREARLAISDASAVPCSGGITYV